MMGTRTLLHLLLAHLTASQLRVNRHFRGDIVTYQGQLLRTVPSISTSVQKLHLVNISSDVRKYKKLISNSFRSEFLIQISVFGHVPNFHMSMKKVGAKS